MTRVPPWKPLHILFFFLFITAIEFFSVSSQLTPERTTLLNLKQRWGNPPSLRNWKASSSPCNWPEVQCNANGSVTGLDLISKRLTGNIPPFICDLRNLRSLYLSDNFLTGEFPRAFCNCSKLVEINLANNGFVGRLPDDLDRLSRFMLIDLGDNNFTGEIPPTIGNLSALMSLWLNDNLLSSELPSRVAWNLSRLEISDNKFPGQIPSRISSWTKLNVFKASNNLFTGEIPTAFTSLSQLSVLLLDGGSLSGELPSEIKSWNSLTVTSLIFRKFAGVTLTTLHLARNRLSGPIPPVIRNLKGILDLDLSENQFSDEIPPQLSRLKLTTLNLSSNNLSGKFPFAFDNLGYEGSFMNNPNLCTASPIPNLHYYAKSTNSHKIPAKIPTMIVALSAFIIVIAIMCMLFVYKRYLKEKQMRDLTTMKVVETCYLL